MVEYWFYLNCVVEKLMFVVNIDVVLFIGYNCFWVLLFCEVVLCFSFNGFFVQWIDLGWGIVGVINFFGNFNCVCSYCVLLYSFVVGKDIFVLFCICFKEVMLFCDVLKVFEFDFLD